MKSLLLAAGLGVLGLGAALAAGTPAARAADANNPYGNVDHSNDAGNDTGDSRVDALNRNQLDKTYQGTWQLQTPSDGGLVVPAQPNMVAPPAPPPPPAPPGVVVR
ncbi:MAG TPA: hypothetical protein VGF36_03215 [Rhodopila sp.]